MPTATVIPDLTTDELAALSDKMKAAEQQRANRERAAQGRRQMLRQARRKIAKIEAEITKTKAERDDKARTRDMLAERLKGLDSPTQNDPAMSPEERRDERLALERAIALAEEEGCALTAKWNVPSTDRATRLLNDASPPKLNWRTPIAELERRLEALTAERGRLQARLKELGEDDTGAGEVAA